MGKRFSSYIFPTDSYIGKKNPITRALEKDLEAFKLEIIFCDGTGGKEEALETHLISRLNPPYNINKKYCVETEESLALIKDMLINPDQVEETTSEQEEDDQQSDQQSDQQPLLETTSEEIPYEEVPYEDEIVPVNYDVSTVDNPVPECDFNPEDNYDKPEPDESKVTAEESTGGTSDYYSPHFEEVMCYGSYEEQLKTFQVEYLL